MTKQAKDLKALLKSLNIDDGYGRLSVRTEKFPSGEFGSAASVVRLLTENERNTLTEKNEYIKIFNRGSFSIVKY